MPLDMLSNAELQAELEARSAALDEREKAFEAAVLAGLRTRVGQLPDRDPGLVDGHALWAAPVLDDFARIARRLRLAGRR